MRKLLNLHINVKQTIPITNEYKFFTKTNLVERQGKSKNGMFINFICKSFYISQTDSIIVKENILNKGFNTSNQYGRSVVAGINDDYLSGILASLFIDLQWKQFAYFLKKVFLSTPIKKHKYVLLYTRKLLEKNIDNPFSQVTLISVKFKGKLSVTGNARKRTFKIIYKNKKKTHSDLLKTHFFLIFTQTGALSVFGFIKYTR